MRAALRRFFCGLRGHDALLSYTKGLRVVCHSCGFESPGFSHRIVAFTPSPEAQARSIRDRFARRMQEQ